MKKIIPTSQVNLNRLIGSDFDRKKPPPGGLLSGMFRFEERGPRMKKSPTGSVFFLSLSLPLDCSNQNISKRRRPRGGRFLFINMNFSEVKSEVSGFPQRQVDERQLDFLTRQGNSESGFSRVNSMKRVDFLIRQVRSV